MDPRPIRDLRPNVGDRIYLATYEVETTVIAYDHKDTMKPYLVGWRREEIELSKKADMGSNILTGGSADPRRLPECQYLTDIMQYVFNEWISGSALCALVHTQGGMKCVGKHCGTFVQYATPNQKDGSFLCYPCRQRPSYMTQQTKE